MIARISGLVACSGLRYAVTGYPPGVRRDKDEHEHGDSEKDRNRNQQASARRRLPCPLAVGLLAPLGRLGVDRVLPLEVGDRR